MSPFLDQQFQFTCEQLKEISRQVNFNNFKSEELEDLRSFLILILEGGDKLLRERDEKSILNDYTSFTTSVVIDIFLLRNRWTSCKLFRDLISLLIKRQYWSIDPDSTILDLIKKVGITYSPFCNGSWLVY